MIDRIESERLNCFSICLMPSRLWWLARHISVWLTVWWANSRPYKHQSIAHLMADNKANNCQWLSLSDDRTQRLLSLVDACRLFGWFACCVCGWQPGSLLLNDWSSNHPSNGCHGCFTHTHNNQTHVITCNLVVYDLIGYLCFDFNMLFDWCDRQSMAQLDRTIECDQLIKQMPCDTSHHTIIDAECSWRIT
jgi:hypothetical protein